MKEAVTQSVLNSQKNMEVDASVMKRASNVFLVTAAPFDPILWALRNPWLSEGQPDDRRPMNRSVAPNGGKASEHRAFARRSHQVAVQEMVQSQARLTRTRAAEKL
jgi:hypothetical protein